MIRQPRGLVLLVLCRCLIAAALACAVSGNSARAAQTPDASARLAAQAAEALAGHRYADAQRAFEQLRDLSPSVAEIHANLAFAYYQQGKFGQAVDALRQALKLKPALPNASTLLAMSLSELGRFAEALPGLERAFKQSTDKALHRAAGLQLQRAYTGLGRDADAVAVALQLAREYPKDPEVLYHASRLHANFAFVTLRDLAAAAPDSVWVHLAAGEADESQGLDDAALQEYRAVTAVDPKRPGIHFRIGRVLLARAGRADAPTGGEAEALAAFQRELENDPSNANAAYEIGEIHRKAADFAKARQFFEMALTHYADFEDALIGLGRTLVVLQQPQPAIAPLTKATELNPKSEIAYYQLAQAYRALGDSAAQRKALTTFEQLRVESGRASPASRFVRPEVTKQTLDKEK